MQTIVDFLTSIGNVIVTAYEFLVDTINGLVYVVRILYYFVSNVPLYFAWLPPEFMTIVVMIFSVAVVYKILGREG